MNLPRRAPTTPISIKNLSSQHLSSALRFFANKSSATGFRGYGTLPLKRKKPILIYKESLGTRGRFQRSLTVDLLFSLHSCTFLLPSLSGILVFNHTIAQYGDRIETDFYL